MILIGRGLDFMILRSMKRTGQQNLNQKLCSCQGVKTSKGHVRRKKRTTEHADRSEKGTDVTEGNEAAVN